MLIEIKKDSVHIKSLSQKPIVKKFLESGLKLNVFEKIHAEYKLVDWIYKELKINDNEIYLSKFWAHTFCEQAGLEKKEFINFQVLAFEIKEINDSLNFIKVFRDNKRYDPNWEKTAKRFGRDTKKMIKFYKRTYPTIPGECNYTKINPPAGYSKLCCVCGNKDILLLRS